jgi:hypothetical protein
MVFEAGKLVDSVVVAAPDGPSKVLDTDEVVDGAKNSMDSFAASLDTGGRFANANKSVHYHHRIDGYPLVWATKVALAAICLDISSASFGILFFLSKV